MASPAQALIFNTDFDAHTGEAVPVVSGLVRVTAPNASAYTFTGTNSFIVGHDSVAVIDPGPDSAGHQAALERAVAGRRIEAIILSHTHRDHSASARRLADTWRVPLWLEGRHRLSRPLRRFERNPIQNSCDWDLVPDRKLADGEVIEVGGVHLSVHTTPGHCANHLAFGLVGTPTLLTGDHIMGWNSTLVSVPDGSMADYLASLDKVIALEFTHYVPAHGGPIADGVTYAQALKAHREARNAQVLAAVTAGADTLGKVVSAVYPKIALPVRLAARMTVTAHVEYLEGLGELTVRHGPFGARLKAD
ncbi:MAG: fold metallo-hydrolase [Devosia sp.]|uniref:MBL fold metallo-hydrolase n=1 Tax=Devosia sp. TaxID=1871048 RepID=UPI00261DF63A|nr:MBL fold metallo-hydrolase [Devosia sp.]MDB5588157.1 fold metallo-hydrolase [Devosia sp.]